MKPLSKSQRVHVWRVARRYLGHALNDRDGVRATIGMVPGYRPGPSAQKLADRVLATGRRLGRRIFSRCMCHSQERGQGHNAIWTDRNLVVIDHGEHAGKIGSWLCHGRSGWRVTTVPIGGTIECPTLYLVIREDGSPPAFIKVAEGFTNEQQARGYALTAAGQLELRETFLRGRAPRYAPQILHPEAK